MERVLERFNMKGAKPVSTLLANHFKLSRMSCPTSQDEKEAMAAIPYSSAVGSLMYTMVCTGQILLMQLELLAGFFPIREKNIRKL